jgi:uncharacterized protein YqeY
MSILERVNQDIADAMRARDQARLAPLRMLKAALVNRGIEKGRPLEPGDEQQVVASLVKQRRDAIEQFRAGRRGDLADREAAEIPILETYLPPALDTAEVARTVDEVIAELGATTPKDLGRVMKSVMERLQGGRVDGRAVNDIVRQRLVGSR